VPAIEHLFACLTHAQIPIDRIVHSAHSVTCLNSLPPSAVLKTSAEISAVYDLKRFAQVIVRTQSTLEDSTPLVETQWSIVVRGMGGFGGHAPPRGDAPFAPKAIVPTFRYEQVTSPEQAALYRLSGDTNPLHIDPELAKSIGFQRGPILHGLCTFGFAARAIIKGFCEGDASRLKFISGRFQKPVWPGETLVTDAWQLDDRIVFQTSSKERDEVVLGYAWARVS
jgi:acyl dehydratase